MWVYSKEKNPRQPGKYRLVSAAYGTPGLVSGEIGGSEGDDTKFPASLTDKTAGNRMSIPIRS